MSTRGGGILGGMTGKLAGLGVHVRAIVDGLDARACRRLAIAVLAVQLAGAIAAASTHLMLHGDGAFYVYSSSVGAPWTLKWSHIPVRFAVYLTTALPSYWISRALHLSPLATADLTGFILYLVPTLQYAAACALVWRSAPRYLIYPAAQYALSTAMGFGFPSEILLSPGFLWICVFLTAGRHRPGPLFLISLFGLAFSHELAIPSVLVAVFLAVRRLRDEPDAAARGWRLALLGAGTACLIIAYGLARFTGGGGDASDHVAIYVFDPRRILANPEMWLMLTIAGASTAVFVGVWRSRLPGACWALAAIAAAAVPLVIGLTAPSFDFALGRYDSERTVVGVLMVLLSLAFALAARGTPEPAPPPRDSRVIPFALTTALAVSAGAGAAFILDWNLALHGLERVVWASADASAKFVPASRMQAYALPRQAAALERMDYFWALPYRSIVLADGREPVHIAYGEVSYRAYCAASRRLSALRGDLPASTRAEMQAFSCAYVPPPHPAQTREKLRALIRSISRWLVGQADSGAGSPLR